MKKNFLLTIALLSFAGLCQAETVNFHIIAGTGSNAWNTSETSIVAKVGDVIRFFNDDNVTHRLHTYGAPCEHGPAMPQGTQWDCVVSEAYSSKTEGPLYDHYVGEKAEVWIEASQQ